MLQKIKVKEVLRQSHVEALPEVFIALQGAGGAKDVAAILQHEPALAARFLCLVNALYQTSFTLDAVDEALRTTGFEPSIDLLLANVAVDLFWPLGPDIVSRAAFWRHSIACAVAARAVAIQRKEANVERFFVAGLLHDVGSLLIYTNISEAALLSILRGRDVNGPLYELEHKVIGQDHAQFGAEVLKALGLPEWLQEAVGNHHAPASAQNFPVEAAVVHVADIIVNAMKLGTRGEFKVPPLAPAAWDRIGLKRSALGSIVKRVDELTESLIACLIKH